MLLLHAVVLNLRDAHAACIVASSEATTRFYAVSCHYLPATLKQ
jgi:hypothetical protein